MDLRKELYQVLFPNQLNAAEEGDLTALPREKLVTLPAKPRDDVGPWEFAMSKARRRKSEIFGSEVHEIV